MNIKINNFITKIKMAMVANNLNQKELALKVAHYKPTFTAQLLSQKLKTGKFTLEELMLIADVLNCTLDFKLNE